MSYQYERVSTPATGLRLHLNENTSGCSPKVLDVLRKMTREDAAFYPDYDAAIDAVARRLRVDADEVLLTNGLDEGILAVAIAALRGSPPDAPHEAIVVVPAFDMYGACTDVAGGKVVEVPLRENFAFDTRGVLDAVGSRTRLIFLTDPNNPTGQRIPHEDVIAIAKAAPGATILLDEAYADFAGETFIDRSAFPRLSNVIVGRTFAKAYGIAGLRAGALVGRPEALEPLRRIVPPYSVNSCAALALPVALGDTGYYDWYLAQVRESKELLYDAFTRLGVEFWPSAGNFVLARFGARCRDVIDGLAARRIFVRDRSADYGCKDAARIAAGVVEHTRACIAGIEEVLCGAEP